MKVFLFSFFCLSISLGDSPPPFFFFSFSLKDVSEERDVGGQAGSQRAAAAADFESVAQRHRPRLQPAGGATGDQGRQLLIQSDALKHPQVHASLSSWRPRRPLLASYTTLALVRVMVWFSSLHA